MTPIPADDTSVASTNHVELATLTIASSFLDHHHQVRHDDDHENDEATLHLHCASAAETSAALIADQAEAGKSAPSTTGAIQAVVDLTVLSDLARANEDEFVIGLHREAHDHHYNPRDSFEESESSSSNESALAETMEDELYFRGGERQPLMRKIAFSSIAKETTGAQVTMDANAFAEALENAIPIPDTTVDTCDNITVVGDEGEDGEQIEYTHEAFLLEMPGDQAGNYILALPEIEQDERDEDDIYICRLIRRFPHARKGHVHTFLHAFLQISRRYSLKRPKWRLTSLQLRSNLIWSSNARYHSSGMRF